MENWLWKFLAKGREYLNVQDLLEDVDFSQDMNFEDDDAEDGIDIFDLEEDSAEELEEEASDEIPLDSIILKEDMFSETDNHVTFPYILIEGIETQEEFSFLNGLSSDSDTIPAYTIVEDSLVPLMQFDFSLQIFLNLHFMGNYKVTLRKSADTSVPIDIENPEQLVKFIKL